MKLIGFYDYTVILTYTSIVSAIIGMVQAAKGSFSAAVVCLPFSPKRVFTADEHN